VAKIINSSDQGNLPQTEEMEDAAEVSAERLERTEEGQFSRESDGPVRRTADFNSDHHHFP
jgi:hypothetical protein